MDSDKADFLLVSAVLLLLHDEPHFHKCTMLHLQCMVFLVSQSIPELAEAAEFKAADPVPWSCRLEFVVCKLVKSKIIRVVFEKN